MTDRGHGGDGTDDADAPPAYVPVRSMDPGAISHVAAGDDRIALASVSGGISVAAADSDASAQFGVEGRPTGLAVGPLVYVATDGNVYGYAADGTSEPEWRTPVDAVSALCWIPEPSRVVAATDAGEFVVLDADSGTERRRIDRAHADVSEDVSLAGRDGEFLAGESWYLTGFDADGDRHGEAMLDGTVTGVGLLDSVAVVSLHGGELVGVADDGTTVWTRTVDAEWLAPRGTGALYVATDRGTVRVAADGTVTDAGIDAGDDSRIVTTTDGSLACQIDGRTVEVLRPRASVSGVDLSVSPASLRIGDALSVTVESRDAPASGSVTVDADGGSFGPDSRSVSLSGGDRATARFTLDDAVESLVSVRASFDPADADADRVTTDADVQVRQSTPGPMVDAECVAVSEGRAVVEVTVRVPDGDDLPTVSIDPGDVTIDAEPGRSSVTRTHELPLNAGRLTVTTPDGGTADAEVSPPAAPLSASVRERTDGFVDVDLSNDAGVPVDDEVQVSGDPLAAPVDRPVSLDPGDRLTLVLPAVHAGPGEITVDAAAVSTTAGVSLDRAAPGVDVTGGDPRPGQPAAGRRADDPEPAASRSGGRTGDGRTAADGPGGGAEAGAGAEPDAASGPTGAGVDAASEPEAGTPPGDTTVSDRASGAGAGVGTEAAAGTDTASGPSEPAPHPEPTAADDSAPASRDPIELTRGLAADSANEGHALEETLTIDSRSTEPQSVALESGDDRVTVDLEPEATRTVSRYHAGWDAEAIEIPAVTARTDGFETALPAESVPIDPAPVVVRPVLSVGPGGTAVRLDVRNDLDAVCSVLAVGSQGFADAVSFDNFEVAPGAEVHQDVTTSNTPAERPAVTFVRIDSRRRPIRTVGAVHDSTAPPVAVSVASVDVLDDRDTNVVLEVQNDGDTPLDVHVEATGAAPDEYLYAPDEIDGLGPGETATHRVECTVGDDRIELPVDVQATPSGGGDVRTTTLTVSGDRTAEASSWRVDADGDGESDAPTTLSTPFAVDAAE